MQALEDHGISDHYLAECHVIDAREILEATTDLLRSNPQITAIFGVNDETALAVMEVAQDLGRQVPGDLSVIGFDDIDLASCVTPSLTTMHVDKAGMGRLAVHLLVNRASHPEASSVKVVIGPRLIERDSVCAI